MHASFHGALGLISRATNPCAGVDFIVLLLGNDLGVLASRPIVCQLQCQAKLQRDPHSLLSLPIPILFHTIIAP